MKKFLTITGICVVTLLALLLILPFALKGKVGDIVKSEGNKMLNAQFDFETLDISLIRNFPSATVSLENFWLKGTGKFENDTLAKAKELSATVNLFSLFGDSGYEISEILMEDTRLHAIVSEDGSANWDIMKPSDTPEEEVSEEVSPFRIQLENLSVDGLTVIYDDRQSKMYAEIANLDATCSGDFGNERTLLEVKAKTPMLTYAMNGVPFLNKVQLGADMNIDADFQNGTYTLKDNTIELNAIQANLDGWMKQIEEGWDMDVRLNSNKVGFKEILSLIPGIYTKEFKDLKTDGKVEFKAFAKGILKGDSIVPQFDVKLDVKDANFHYPSMPAGIDAINTVIAVKNPGGNMDATTIDIQPFNFVMAGHSFGVTAQLKNPISDLDFRMTAKGKLDLGKVKEVYPMENMTLNGRVDADMRLSGKLSAIEKEQYDQILAEGKLTLNDMALQLTDLPKIDIKHSTFNFSPRYLKLSETTINIGKNDLTFDSQFENYLAYAFQGKTLKGTLNVSSNYLNLNDFLPTEVADSLQITETATTKDTTDHEDNTQTEKPAATQEAASVGLHIPGNIDFRMQTNLKQVLLNKMKFDDINGLLIVKDEKVDMKNLSMKAMGGKVVANGAYATPSKQPASMNGSFALQELNFAQTYTELDVVKQLAPIFAGLKGSYSGNIQIDALLNEQLAVEMESIQGKGSLSTKDLSLSGVKFIDQVATIVNKPSLKNIEVQNLKLDFTIDKGRVTTDPFDLKLGDYTMNLSGSTGLDQTIDYRGKITIPVSSKGKKRMGTVDMLIKGTFDSPKVSIDMASLAKNIAGQLFDSLTGDDKTSAEGDSLKPKKKNIFDKARDLFKKN